MVSMKLGVFVGSMFYQRRATDGHTERRTDRHTAYVVVVVVVVVAVVV